MERDEDRCDGIRVKVYILALLRLRRQTPITNATIAVPYDEGEKG